MTNICVNELMREASRESDGLEISKPFNYPEDLLRYAITLCEAGQHGDEEEYIYMDIHTGN
jgi:hypothetical protein